MADYAYFGTELDLFAHALRWKNYWRCNLSRFVRGAVLEIGAGNGNNTRFLNDIDRTRWVCIEPDRTLCAQLTQGVPRGRQPEAIVGTLADLRENSHFDTILYLDVLEHIKDDAAELQRAARHLRSNGHLIVLAPAHQLLYSPFDRAIGHFRRYSRRSLCDAAPADLSLVMFRYLDSVGFAASLANRFLLRQSMPTQKQLKVWDHYFIPISRYVDPLLRYRFGKSIVGIWQKSDPVRQAGAV